MFEININPIAFTLGSLEVRWYGILTAVAAIVLIGWMVRQIERGAKLSYDTLLVLALIGIPSGIIFSRLLHVIDFWEFYSQHPEAIIGGEGLSIYGAIIGATLGIWIYSRFSKLNFGYIVDLLAPVIPLAHSIGRVGCLINGCCYGMPNSSCGIIYTHPESYAPLGVAVLPTQLYEIGFLLVLFGILMWLRGKLKPDGSLFMVYLGLYSLWRLGIDFIRDGTPFLFNLHQAQVIAIGVLLITVPLLIIRTRWKSPNETEISGVTIKEA